MPIPSRGIRLSLLAFGLFYTIPSFAYRMAAWIAPWDPNSLTSIQINAGRLTESNPVWYSLDSRGNIVKNAGAEDPTWRAAMVGTDMLPTLQNRTSGAVNVTLTRSLISSKRRGDHAQAITNLVVNNGYAGIDIDYEGLALSDRPNYTAFIQILASDLHAAGKRLSVVVSAKTSDAQNWSGPGGEDYAAIAAAADQMKIMCYDYHWSTSSAGPIAPVDWVDSVTTYAESVAPSSKIIIGDPWYGYDWVGSSGTSVSDQQAMNTAAANGATITHDVNGEATYAYGSHIVYFEDAFSYNTKMDMLVRKHPNLLGFAHWVAGVEDPNVWTRVAALKNGATSASAITVASSLNPSTFQQMVTFSAVVTGSGGIPTGTVSFKDGSLILGTATVDTSGNASFSTSSLGAGTHSITAAYSGDTTFMASVSAAMAQSVAQASTASQLSSNINPSSFGQAMTLSATVSSPAGVPSGSVTFFDGTASLGSAALSSGQASVNVSLSVGSHALTAQYSGDANFASSSAGMTQIVIQGASTTSLTVSPNPSTFGQAVALTARVSGNGPTPTGSVTFFDGVTALATVMLSSGSASFSANSLAIGSHSFSAQYSGDPNFSASASAAVGQMVNPAPTSTSLASSPNPSTLNQSVTLTSTVTSSAGVPAGSVTFLDGTNSLGSATLDANGKASIALSTLTTGAHSLTAQYQASGSFAGSTSAAATQTVTLYASTTTLLSAANPSTYGSAVTLTASVASTGGIPTGTITFQDGTTALGTATLNSGQATLIAGGLTTGTHSITAVYSGDPTFSGSTSSAVSQVVNQAVSSIAIASSLNPSAFGQSITLTATISSSASTPTGSVTFVDGSATLGTASVNGAGTASIAIASLATGTHSITAQYGGDSNFNASTSIAMTQTVNAGATTTALTASPNPAVSGTTVTFSAIVSSPNGTPSGSVTFQDGSAVLGSVSVDSTGKATLATSALTIGTHSITAQYGGASGYGASASAPVSQVINAATAYHTAVWIVSWMSASLTSVQQNAGTLTESNPVWYSLDSSGNPVAGATANSSTWRAAMTGTLVIPTIQNVVNGSFSKTVVENIISTSSSRDAHAQTLTNIVINNGYDGLDLDYEGLSYTDRSNFTAFVTSLSNKMHAAGKLLSLTLSPKTSDSQTWDGPGADDYVALAPLGDTLKLMIYDYHWSTSSPGDITPLSWLDGVLTYAQSTIPNSKIIAGLPWYGYDWVGSNGTGVGYQQAMNTAAANGATVTHDADGEATYTYSNHTVYFQDAYSYQQKVNVIKTKHSGIGGVTAWVAGDEDPAIWTQVGALKSGS